VVAGSEEAYAQDARYRTAHHGPELMPEEAGRLRPRPVLEPVGGGATALVVEEDGLRIGAFAVDHDPVRPAYGYRFDYRGRSVVVSGDTRKSAGLIQVAQGADVLVHEAQANHIVREIGEAAARAGRSRVATIMGDIPSYHTSPVEAAEVANEAGVGLLVLYHLTPPPPMRLAEWVFTRGVSDVRPDGWILADDGLLVELPAGSRDVRTRQLR
jgi:ribonuclease Z